MTKFLISAPQYIQEQTTRQDAYEALDSRLEELFACFSTHELRKKSKLERLHYEALREGLRLLVRQAYEQQSGGERLSEGASETLQSTRPAHEWIGTPSEKMARLSEEREAVIRELFATNHAGCWVRVLNEALVDWIAYNDEVLHEHRVDFTHQITLLINFIIRLGDIEREIKVLHERMKGGQNNG